MAKILGYRESKAMHYSCFNPRTGMYDYYTDGESGIPINGDLPVPKLPKATQLGVAAIEAGRSLPSSAVRVGRGIQARGQIVQCGRGFSGFGTSPDGLGSFDAVVDFGKKNWKLLVGATLLGASAVVLFRRS